MSRDGTIHTLRDANGAPANARLIASEELEVDALENTHVKRIKLLESAFSQIEMTEVTSPAVIHDLDGDHLSLPVNVDGLAALSVSTVLLDGGNHRVVVGGRAAASRVVELSASVPGDLAPLGNPVALLEILLALRASSELDVAGFALERALAESVKAGIVGVNSGGDSDGCREQGEEGGGELHHGDNVEQTCR